MRRLHDRLALAHRLRSRRVDALSRNPLARYFYKKAPNRYLYKGIYPLTKSAPNLIIANIKRIVFRKETDMMARICFGVFLSAWLGLTIFRVVSYTPQSPPSLGQLSEHQSQFDVQHIFWK
jgi:hypothetical protein